uniref:Conserved plasma membrane protein n=1 Tax=Soboliphyme baturini TaxID=241478 RepID=A0A183J342_9BILA
LFSVKGIIHNVLLPGGQTETNPISALTGGILGNTRPQGRAAEHNIAARRPEYYDYEAYEPEDAHYISREYGRYGHNHRYGTDYVDYGYGYPKQAGPYIAHRSHVLVRPGPRMPPEPAPFPGMRMPMLACAHINSRAIGHSFRIAMPLKSLGPLVREALFPQLNRLHGLAKVVYARLCHMFIIDIDSRLPFYIRFYIYALHGLFIEIFFTAIWQLHGLTSLWAAIIYGLSILFGEQLYVRLQNRMNIFLRGFVYLLWAYVWEFWCVQLELNLVPISICFNYFH